MLSIRSYHVPIEDIRKKIREVDNSNEDPESLPFITERLRQIADMPKKDDLDMNLKFEQNKIDRENHIKEIEKNLKDDIKEVEKNLKNDVREIENKLDILLNEIKNLKK